MEMIPTVMARMVASVYERRYESLESNSVKETGCMCKRQMSRTACKMSYQADSGVIHVHIPISIVSTPYRVFDHRGIGAGSFVSYCRNLELEVMASRVNLGH